MADCNSSNTKQTLRFLTNTPLVAVVDVDVELFLQSQVVRRTGIVSDVSHVDKISMFTVQSSLKSNSSSCAHSRERERERERERLIQP